MVSDLILLLDFLGDLVILMAFVVVGAMATYPIWRVK